MNAAHLSGSPIQVAARLGHLEVVEFLIAAGANVNVGTLLSTPLLDAIATQHFEIALKLIEAGADPDLTAEFDCVPPIAIAAIQGSATVMQALIDAGGDIDAVVPQMTVGTELVIDSPPIVLAARWGHAEVVDVLLRAGANCDRPDGAGLTAYQWAVTNHHPQVLEVLKNTSNSSTKAVRT